MKQSREASAMTAMRMQFLSIAAIVALGIWHTGLDTVSWILYIPVIFLSIAGLTGFCPGLIIWHRLGFSDKPVSCKLPHRR